ncbi:TPA: hypothetical protein NPP49_003783 [Klebsiella variicola subsp. variicola]|nr:hypothetical protein [Klebsiella variicola subsp. variicola]HCI6768829.1 hypothetical protein [Klebsiella variicola subsp. variicola]
MAKTVNDKINVIANLVGNLRSLSSVSFLNKKGTNKNGIDGINSLMMYRKKDNITGTTLEMFVMLGMNKSTR